MKYFVTKKKLSVQVGRCYLNRTRCKRYEHFQKFEQVGIAKMTPKVMVSK